MPVLQADYDSATVHMPSFMPTDERNGVSSQWVTFGLTEISSCSTGSLAKVSKAGRVGT